jgi:ATP-dependent protease Clp ATPase subunit
MFWPFGLACSFCHRNSDEVAKLVAGPRALLVGPPIYICDACVAIAAKIMEQPVTPAARPRPPAGGGGSAASRSPVPDA